MKRTLMLLAALCLLLSLCACTGTPAASDPTVPTVPAAPEELPVSTSVPYLLNSNEYALYMNIFYNQMAEDYLGQTQVKTGVFTKLSDSFNQRTRYYVWGYNDETKCCDWQWEFVPTDPEALPADGSLVEVTGTFAQSDEALDGYWLDQAQVTPKTLYQGPACDVALTAMDGTLERVQILNMQYYPQNYQGSAVSFYGRVMDGQTIQHPYYDGSWTQTVAGVELPPVGTVVVVTGYYNDGVVTNAVVTPTTDY